jgi:hypothetical protein
MGQSTTIQETYITPIKTQNETRQLNQWMFDTIRPYLRGRILEIGSGLGAVSSLFIENGITIHLSDADKQYYNSLIQKHKGVSAVRDIHVIDFHHSDFERTYVESLGAFNLLFALNIIDHGCPDTLTIKNAKLLLRKGGLLILVSPAYTAIYDGLDKDLESWKYYNRDAIQQFYGDDFDIIKARYFSLTAASDKISLSHSGLSVIAVGMKK